MVEEAQPRILEMGYFDSNAAKGLQIKISFSWLQPYAPNRHEPLPPPPQPPQPPLIPPKVRYPFTPIHLAALNRRPRRGVASRHGVVDVDENAGVGGRVGAREGHLALGAPRAAAACDLQLGAAEVELGAACAARTVERDVLDTEQVLAVREAAGDGYGDGLDA